MTHIILSSIIITSLLLLYGIRTSYGLRRTPYYLHKLYIYMYYDDTSHQHAHSMTHGDDDSNSNDRSSMYRTATYVY